jgi:hypothetical protein
MINILQPMMTEIQQEGATTKRVLESVPEDKLAWKPHPKSMSLGQLALHIASIPGNLSRLAQLEKFDVSQANFNPPAPKDAAEILTSLEASLKAAEEYLDGMSESAAAGSWTNDGRREGNVHHFPPGAAAYHHAQPLVSSSRAIVGLP